MCALSNSLDGREDEETVRSSMVHVKASYFHLKKNRSAIWIMICEKKEMVVDDIYLLGNLSS